jgi:hypothetical protein
MGALPVCPQWGPGAKRLVEGQGASPPEADGIFYEQSLLKASEFAYLTALIRVVIIRLTNVAEGIRAFHSFIRSSDSHTGQVPPGLSAHFRPTSSISNVSSNQSFYSHGKALEKFDS